jgi:hypothetical protein
MGRPLKLVQILQIVLVLFILIGIYLIWDSLMNPKSTALTLLSACSTYAVVLVTLVYAITTSQQRDIMEDQLNSMRDQIQWERTFRPRLDAYERFEVHLSKYKSGDTTYFCQVIIPELEYIQPYSSEEVKRKARELHDLAKGAITQLGSHEVDVVKRIETDLRPKLTKEIDDIINAI